MRDGRIRDSPRFFAAFARRNRTAMGTGSRVPEEGTDFLGDLGRENVLKLAGLLLNFFFVLHLQGLREETFGKTMATNDIGGTLLAHRSEVNDEFAMPA